MGQGHGMALRPWSGNRPPRARTRLRRGTADDRRLAARGKRGPQGGAPDQRRRLRPEKRRGAQRGQCERFRVSVSGDRGAAGNLMRPFAAVLLLAGPICQAGAASYDLIIRNGHIIDGTGSPWYAADVGITAGRVAAIGGLGSASATRSIDARGFIVAPGFID